MAGCRWRQAEPRRQAEDRRQARLRYALPVGGGPRQAQGHRREGGLRGLPEPGRRHALDRDRAAGDLVAEATANQRLDDVRHVGALPGRRHHAGQDGQGPEQGAQARPPRRLEVGQHRGSPRAEGEVLLHRRRHPVRAQRGDRAGGHVQLPLLGSGQHGRGRQQDHRVRAVRRQPRGRAPRAGEVRHAPLDA